MKRLCILAHFDAQNEIKRYISHYVEALREHCTDLIFVSVSDLPEAELVKVRALSCEVILRENVGFDFAMWKQAIERVDLHDYDELLLTNSSIFGPLRPLGPFFDAMANDDCDVWGMTDNRDGVWHLQSYFLVCKSRVIHDPVFPGFWNSVWEYRNKAQVIRSYEMGLSTFLVEQGFKLKPLFAQDTLGQGCFLRYPLTFHRRRHNPTCALPGELLERGMPLVKVELLRDNPVKVPLRRVWRELGRTGYDLDLIEFDRPMRRRGWIYDLPPEVYLQRRRP